jgi:predicted metal-dependent phosphoesterase TrpH
MTQTIEIRLTRQDKAAGHYYYVPFEVPAGTTRIDLKFTARRDDECQLDYGLVDPTATDFPSTTGLRGWTGHAREEFFTATDDATPGYLYGPIEPGTWRAQIGMSTIPEEGVSVRVDVRLDDAPRPVKAQPVRTNPVRKGAGWYKGDVHCHTFHSDADGSPETLHAAARQAGLDFLAVADHNTITQRQYFYPASSPELVFVRAMEVTTPAGHANAYGVDGMVDYRLTRPEHARMLADHVHALGGLLSVNHDKPTIPWRFELPQVDCMEVWQSTWIEWNWISLARYQHRLAAGLRITAIGGSDWHQPAEVQPESPYVLARPTTVLYLEELSEAAILKAMKAGHGYITEDPSGPHLSLMADGKPMGSMMRRAREVVATVKGAGGDRLSWIDASGEVESVMIPNDDCTLTLSAPDEIETFVRAEIVAEASHGRLYKIAEEAPEVPMLEDLLPIRRQQAIRRAISNPIYFGH